MRRELSWVEHADPDLTLPDELDSTDVMVLVDGRWRLTSVTSVASGLRRRVDGAIVERVGPWGAIRAGNSLLRVVADRRRRIVDHHTWWRFVVTAIRHLDDHAAARLLEQLFNADELRVRGLRPLAEAAGLDEQTVRDTFVGWEDTARPWKVTEPPRSTWPKWAETMSDGDIRAVEPENGER